jgi:UDP:flavonoid glycosyltransferase YjiC (YdhE family)
MSANVLMVTWDGAGNIPPELALCGALVDAGHNVHVFTHDSLKKRVETIGASFVPIRQAGQIDTHDVTSEEESLQKLMENVFLCDGLLADLDAAIDKLSPNAVIVDSMMLLPLALAKQRNIPTIGFHHTLANFVLGGLFDLWSAAMKEPFDAILNNRGLSTYEKPILALTAADAILTSTYAEFDSFGDSVPDPWVHIGPLKRDTPAKKNGPSRRFPAKPLIVVSLSTSFMNQRELIQKLVDALSGLEVEGLVTTGPAISARDLVLPENVSAVEFIPHEEVLPFADLLITHAGHGTVMAGVTFGTPMLCVPMGRDQPLVAQRASDLGLAHICQPDASAATITDVISAALQDTEMTENARRFSERVKSHPGIERAVERVEDFLA